MANNFDDKEVKKIFEKKFKFQKPNTVDEEQWQLPAPQFLHDHSNTYNIPALQKVKETLNEVKSQLNDYNNVQWSKHTASRNPSKDIIKRLKFETKAEFVTIAWCKFYEILCTFPCLVRNGQLNSLHLCEAPGAFIASLNHYLYTNYTSSKVEWIWRASSFNPYYEGNNLNEMICDDRFIFYTLDKWIFYQDFTGNLLNLTNLQVLFRDKEKLFPNGEIHLITADGSVNCFDNLDCQEEYVAQLHCFEIIAALNMLSENGCFIIKMFTLFETRSINLMFILNCAFKEVHVFKPATSKRGNSEIYVICLYYQKYTNNLKDISNVIENDWRSFVITETCLPKVFLQQHISCCKLFTKYQIMAINDNIASYNRKLTKKEIFNYRLFQENVSDEFLIKYNVKRISEKYKILCEINMSIEKYIKFELFSNSFTEREMLKISTRQEVIFNLEDGFNKLHNYLNNLYDENNESIYMDDMDGMIYADTCLHKSKPITNLHSSQFVNYHLMIFYSRFIEVMNIDPLWHCYINMADILIDLNNMSYLDVTDLSNDLIKTNFSQHQQTFFINLINHMDNKRITNIQFRNLPFITHFSMSILFYMALRMFKSFEITISPNISIILNGQRSTYNLSIEYLKSKLCIKNSKISEKSLPSSSSSSSLSSSSSSEYEYFAFVDIRNLHRNTFSKAVVRYNSMILLKALKFNILHVIK